MPIDPDAPVSVTAFDWVPEFARGFVRDLRVRWALEEAGIPYSVRPLDATTARPQSYLEEQPWGQVPAYRDPDVAIFESGAIVLHIAEASETLLPTDPQQRARAKSWLFAALNSVEPAVMQLATINIFAADQPWAEPSRPYLMTLINGRLDGLERQLQGREWLEESFTIGDLMMAHVVRGVEGTGCIEARPALAAWHQRCLARPAYARALEAQLADFHEKTPA
ncbi:MAG: glutathione S-transferase [Sphingomonas sp.]|nr:glutathione S-transferase [Sphingomonas sp.]|tara:strand:+ start:729 stop:1397 length:669 start_codon:yes stop_codon:yes gene_type:complete